MKAGLEVPLASDFNPAGLLANGNVQTIVSSSRWRRLQQRSMHSRLERDNEPVILHLNHGVRLSGIYNRTDAHHYAKGLSILLHGWEGSVDSAYMIQLGQRLLRDGWDIFRLNFRDHGDSHGLNRGLFNSCLLDEVVAACKCILQRWQLPHKPVTLTGFSLGGNFALRLAVVAEQENLPFDRVMAVCPIIDPSTGLFALEHHAPWIYHWYFMRNWRASLKRKAQLFPDTFHFTHQELRQNMRALTATMVDGYTSFTSLEDYLEGYSVAGSKMACIGVPTSILAARDDPIIPADDFYQLDLSPVVELAIVDHGGHCGFLANWHCHVFTDKYIAARFNALA